MKTIIVGIGGTGASVLNKLAKQGYKGPLCAIETDKCQINVVDRRISVVRIGDSVTRGMGCGSEPELGRRSAIADASLIRGGICGKRTKISKNPPVDIATTLTEAKSIAPDAVIICAGLGGGTGGGASPEVAKIAKRMGCFVAALVQLPLPIEYNFSRRSKHSEAALSLLEKHCDSLVRVEFNSIRGKNNLLIDELDWFFAESIKSYNPTGISA